MTWELVHRLEFLLWFRFNVVARKPTGEYGRVHSRCPRRCVHAGNPWSGYVMRLGRRSLIKIKGQISRSLLCWRV